jgi:hypothetical protein
MGRKQTQLPPDIAELLAYLIGWSSAVCWLLPTVGVPPPLPTVARPRVPGLGPSSTPYGRILVAQLPPDHRYESDRYGVKYHYRSDAAEIVQAQNEPGFWLRRLGLDFARYSAPDVYGDRTALAGRFPALLRDIPPGEPIRWWKDVPGVGPVEPKREDWPSPHPLGLVLPAGWRRGVVRPGWTAKLSG